MTSRLTPLQICERLFGGPLRVAVACGLGSNAPFNWRSGSGYRDAGDIPSPIYMRRLLEAARAQGLPLTPQMLIFGCEAEELERRIAATAEAPASSLRPDLSTPDPAVAAE